MTMLTSAEIAAVIADNMASIRRDVEAGNGPEIEADAVLIGVAYGISDLFKKQLEELGGTFDQAAFLAACDLDNLIPPESFHYT